MKIQRGALLNTKTHKFKSKNFNLYRKKKTKLGSFFDFHTKRPKLQNRGMHIDLIQIDFIPIYM
jgi:hypothetical protein